MTPDPDRAEPPVDDVRSASEPVRFDRLGRKLVVPALLALAVLVGLALATDARELARHLGEFPLVLLAPVLALSLVNYGLRFVRWQLYLRWVEVELAPGPSLAVFLVGFVLSVTPGKAGELGKAWLARKLGGGQARRSVAAVLAERVTDLAGIALLVAAGAALFPGGLWIAVAGVGAVVAGLALLAWRRAALAVFHLLEKLPAIGPRIEILEDVYERLRALVRPLPLVLALVLSVVAWGAEGVGFGLVVRSYDPGASIAVAVFNYSAATLAGAFSFLPGGLLVSEGALTALQGLQGMDTAAAASATLVIRAATLWFAVALGLVAVPYVARRVRAAGNGD